MMRVRLTAVAGCAFAGVLMMTAALPPDASAQTPTRRPSSPRTAQPTPQRQGTSPSAREPRAPLENEADAGADVSITARVTAESLRFEKVPNPRVEFRGRPRRETAWESERENLPEKVRPGETYRNIGITLRIRSVFADIDRIVAEALGEVPPGDDAPTTPPGASAPPTGSATPPAQAPTAAAANAPRQRRGTARRGRGN